MTQLLEIKELAKKLYGQYSVIIHPVGKFLLSFLVLSLLNGQMGYMAALDSAAITVIISLVCSMLPLGCISFFAAIISLAHMYALSMEVALIGLCVYLVLFLLFFKLCARNAVLLVVTPLLFVMKIPYVLPIALGLLSTPISIFPMACGIIAYYFLMAVIGNASAVLSMEGADSLGKIRLMIDGFVKNKEMVIMVAAFVITVLLVYIIRRLSIDYGWTIAMISGAIVNLVIVLVGALMYDIDLSILGAMLGAVIGILLGKVLEFFFLGVDYTRVERVQFEDDEYYYFVKAIPKMTVPAQERTVKKITTTRQSSYNRKSVTIREEAGKAPRNTAQAVQPAASQGEDDYEELF